MTSTTYYRPAYDATTDGEYSPEVHGAVAMGRFLAALAFAAVDGDVDAFRAVVALPARPRPAGRFGIDRPAPIETAVYNLRHGAHQVVEAITATV